MPKDRKSLAPKLGIHTIPKQQNIYLHGYTRTIQEHDSRRQVLSQEEKIDMKAY
jgi:hypothetical protein